MVEMTPDTPLAGLSLNVGDFYYKCSGIHDIITKFEVVRETPNCYYLCKFDGSCSKIDYASKTRPEDFYKQYFETRELALQHKKELLSKRIESISDELNGSGKAYSDYM